MRHSGVLLSAVMLVLFLLSSCAAKPASEQGSKDALSGKWSGDYGPDADRREPVSLDLKSSAGKLEGTVHAGPRSIPLTKASYTPDTGAIALEFDAQGNGGRTVHYQIDGKVDGDKMSGSWTHDGERGDFHLKK